MRPDRPRSTAAFVILLAAAGCMLLSAALFNPPLLELVSGKQGLAPDTVARVHATQLRLAAVGFALAAAALLVARVPVLGAWLSVPLRTNLLLALLVFCVPIAIAEMVLRVPARRSMSEKTTLFERDAELGWRLRPETQARWGGVEIAINSKGLRGPEIAYDKAPGMTRIVWLGDSVTFGFRLESWEQAYPYRVELALERRTGRRIETVNAAVDGYSSWQQHLWLARDGLRYQPDLVVIGFVLNDVTEKFALRRFGGSGDGFQLSQTAGWVDRVAGGSALLHYARRLGALIRFGPDTQRGAARREALDVEALARHPEREDVRRAWDVTLEEIQQIVELCDARGVRLAIVVFPFAFQLADPAGLSAPQEVLARYAAARRVPSLDLLQPLSRRVQDDGALLEEYFLDEDHLTRLGNQVVAELVAEFLLREKLL